jgi:hypothetical protein
MAIRIELTAIEKMHQKMMIWKKEYLLWWQNTSKYAFLSMAIHIDLTVIYSTKFREKTRERVAKKQNVRSRCSAHAKPGRRPCVRCAARKSRRSSRPSQRCVWKRDQSEPHWANDGFALEWILQLLREAFTEKLEHAMLLSNPNGRLLKIPIFGFWYFETALLSSWIQKIELNEPQTLRISCLLWRSPKVQAEVDQEEAPR